LGAPHNKDLLRGENPVYGEDGQLAAGARIAWAMMFWGTIAAGLGYCLAHLANASGAATSAAIYVSAGLGTCLGCYAGIGATGLARVFAVPCDAAWFFAQVLQLFC
jgi:hypothetical protein